MQLRWYCHRIGIAMPSSSSGLGDILLVFFPNFSKYFFKLSCSYILSSLDRNLNFDLDAFDRVGTIRKKSF